MRSASERRFLLATRSADKLREIREILHGPHEAAIVSLVDIGHQEGAAEANLESYPTFIANALAKAEYFLRTTGIPTLADDSGLVVDALSGRPG
ncbi:MAG: non-canonical purine NTP pyrophosphatase, partial [Planctomycetaceae bacterium]